MGALPGTVALGGVSEVEREGEGVADPDIARLASHAPMTSVTPAVTRPARDNPACECGAILRGAKRPRDCKLFGAACTPETPMGACMVSSEGSCAAYWAYGRFRDRETGLQRVGAP